MCTVTICTITGRFSPAPLKATENSVINFFMKLLYYNKANQDSFTFDQLSNELLTLWKCVCNKQRPIYHLFLDEVSFAKVIFKPRLVNPAMYSDQTTVMANITYAVMMLVKYCWSGWFQNVYNKANNFTSKEESSKLENVFSVKVSTIT